MSKYKWKATDKDGSVHIYKYKPYTTAWGTQWYRNHEDNEDNSFRYVANHIMLYADEWKNSLHYSETGFDNNGSPIEIMQENNESSIFKQIQEMIGNMPVTIEFSNMSTFSATVTILDLGTYLAKDEKELQDIIKSANTLLKYNLDYK